MLALALADYTVTDAQLVALARLDVEPSALAAALALGRELLLAHEADEQIRKRDHAAEARLRRAGEWPSVLREIEGTNGRAWLVDTGAEHWRHAPQPAGPGNPEARIKGLVRSVLIGLGVEPRELREALLRSLADRAGHDPSLSRLPLRLP